MSTVKLPLLKKGEYDIWAMKMEHYLAHTDYPIWEVIQKGNGLPERERERKARTTLLIAIPEDHLVKFHRMTDAKDIWDAIKTRFGGNDKSKKMQKYILKQQFEVFTISNSEGLHKGYDSQSSSSSLNVAFVSSESTNSTNNFSTASSASPSSSQNSKRENSSSYTDDPMYSFFVNQSNSPQLDHEDLEQIDEYDLEEMDLKWQVAMISMRLKKFYKKTGRKLHFDAKEPVGFDKTKVECYNCHKTRHFARECRFKGSQDTRRRESGSFGYKDEDCALMAFNNASSDTEVISCSPKCVESYSKLKKLYDEQRDQLSDANVEILAYSQGIKKVEAQLVTHQNNQLWYEQKIRFMKVDLDDKTYVLTYHKKLLADALKEKEELKTKFAKWQNSSKNLSKLLKTQMSASDKFGLGYGDYRFDGILSYENEVLQSVFFNDESTSDASTLNDRFAKTDGMHAVPLPMTGNYMPSGPDVEIDESQFTYGPKTTQASDSDTRTSDFDSCESNTSDPTTEHMPVVTDPIVISTPKVWTDAPIIEEYESDDECVSTPSTNLQKPREAVQENKTSSETPKVIKKDFHGSRSKMGLGFGNTRKSCFVCGSFGHLIRYCTIHEKRIAKETAINKRVSQDPNQKKNRPSWNKVQKQHIKNQFVPTAVLKRSGTIPFNTARSSGTNLVNTARQNVSTARHNSQAVPTRTANKVSIVDTKMNDLRPITDFKTNHSSTKRPLSRSATVTPKFSKSKVNTARDKTVSAAGDYPQRSVKNKGIVDSGCSRHMTGNKSYLVDYQDYHGGPVTFGGSKGQITGKGKIRSGKLDFDDVCFVKELQQFNLFSVSQMYDKKNKVLFTDTECLVVSPDFKLPDENQVLLRVPRQHNMYNFSLENFVPSEGLTCLIAKASADESNKWHRRLGHVNFKNLNRLVKGNLVRGLPSKIFQNDHTCVACQKGKQHKASCKAKVVSTISQPLQLLHMDLFGPTSVRSLNHKIYCLVITDDFRIKREYSNARTPQQNGVAERKNKTLIEAARTMLAGSFLPNTFWAEAVSTACYVLNRVLVTKPHNKTPYELITGKQPIISYIRPFGCHVTILNTLDHLGKFEEKADEGFSVGYSLSSKAFRVYNLETKRLEENLHVKILENKSSVAGKGPTWLFDLDYLTDSMNYQPVTAKNRANKTTGPEEANHNAGTQDSPITRATELGEDPAQEHYVLPIWSSYTSTIKSSEVKSGDKEPDEVVVLKRNEDLEEQVDQDFLDELEQLQRQEKDASAAAEALRKSFAQDIEDLLHQVGVTSPISTNKVSTDGPSVSTVSPKLSTDGPSVSTDSPIVSTDEPNPYEDNSQILALEDIYDNPSNGIFSNASYDDEGAVANFTNLETIVNVSPIPTSRIHSIHPTTQILGDPSSVVQTRSKINKTTGSHAFVSYIQKQRRNNHKDFQHCLFACFLSQVEPKKIADALEDESWVDAMQEELLQFHIQKVWVFVDLPKGKKTIGLKWVYRNKKDERGVVVKNKARLVAQGHRKEEGIDYDEVFAPVARIEAIRIFLAFSSYMDFVVYQMDVKSAFIYGTIDEEVYVTQPPGFIDPKYPKKVYKVVKALYGLHQAPRAWYATLSTFLLQNGYRRGAIDKTLWETVFYAACLIFFIYNLEDHKGNAVPHILLQNGYRRGAIDKTLFLKKDKKDGLVARSKVRQWNEFEALMKSKFQMGSMGELTFFLRLQVQQKKDGIFVSQYKYVAEIWKKFEFMNVKTASTPIDTQRPLTKDEEAADVDVHLYRSMIGSLMYLTTSRPDIIVSLFELEAYSDSDHAGANLDRKSTTGGCQFLGRRLISWHCKKQTIVATSTTKAEYVAAASCCGQVLWIQNQMLDYGFNFMNTKIHIDNESTICIVKNPVFHSKTKHIEIRHHFIRDAFEKKLIQVLKIHTDNNVADLLTKAFDAGRFQFLLVSIRMMNL
ncbi:putative ribonuclease H-like domain-containing protein [Tanacetum coccineum]